jgi:flagellar hook-associated protein 1 FlgK
MSLFDALSSSLSGLQSVSTQMQIVANNIANAGQTGYTEKTATTTAIVVGNGGGGTEVSGFSRASDDALTTAVNAADSNAGLLSTQNSYLQQVQTILGSDTGDQPPLAEAIAQFSSAWTQLAAEPESDVQQQQVIQAASTLTSQVQQTATAVESLNMQVKTDIGGMLSTLNSNLQQIASLNSEITQALSVNQSAGDLEDQRDQLIQKVSSVMSVTVLPRAQGQIALYTPSGYMLLDGQPQSFSYDGTNVTAALNPTMSLNNVLTGGSLQAAVNFCATTSPASTDPATSVIQKLQSQLNAVVSAFTDSSAGPPQTFANAYDQTASASIGSGSLDLTSKYSGTFGNGISVTLAAGVPGSNTYVATVHVAGQSTTSDESYTVSTAQGSAAFWSDLASDINSKSRLVTATVGSSAATPAASGPTTLTGGAGDSTNGAASVTIPTNGMTFTALNNGSAGNNISVSISTGTNSTTASPSYKVTISCTGQTSEVFDNIDASGGGAAFWTNVANAINYGQNGGSPSKLVMATAGTSTTLPTTGSTSAYSLSGGTDDLESDFFTGTDSTTFAVNASLLDGSQTIPEASSAKVVAAFNDSTKTFTADGLKLTNASYSSLGTGIVSVFQQAASSVSQSSTTATAQQTYLQQRLTNETGVNVDTETAALVTLQNTYAASAHVISIIDQMFTVLEDIGTTTT